VDPETALTDLPRTARKKALQTLMSGEEVLAVVNGREAKAAVLTDRRILLVAGGGIGQQLLRGGLSGQSAMESIDLDHVGSVSASTTAVRIVSGGDEAIIPVWPSKAGRQAADNFVKQVHAQQHQQKQPNRAGAMPAAAPEESVAEQLTKLAKLRDDGVLSDEEFEAQKAAVLKR
jgi:hypothetical protein